MTRISMIIGALFVPGVAVAHPEHVSSGDFGLLHYLTDPFHVGVMAIGVSIMYAIGRSLTRRSSLKRIPR